MKETHEKQHTIDILFVLALFCVFALSTLAVVYIGSQVYSSTVDSMDENFHNYVAIDYITEKVHQSVDQENIEVKTIDHIDILMIHQVYNKENYTTYIYCDQNQLKELFLHDEETFHKEDGQPIMNADSLKMKIESSLLDVSLSINKKTNQSYISLMKGGLSS